MLRYFPLVIAVVAVVAVAAYDGVINHRWVPNTEAQEYAALLGEVPKQIGPWKGEDQEVVESNLRVAGAEGYVSRTYEHEETGERVGVWLIVGPYKHVIRHTPDVCYVQSGASPMHAGDRIYTMDVPGAATSTFWTNDFDYKQPGKPAWRKRVFWSWHKPTEESDEVVWSVGKDDNDARRMYAATPALFKLYFTCNQGSEEQPLAESVCNDFAADFLPLVNELIKSKAAPAGDTAPGEAAEEEEAQADA